MFTGYEDSNKNLASSSQILAWGANSYGQLGIGSKEDQLVPRPVIVPGGICIKYITGGGGHTVALTDNGKVFVCGSNSKGELGLNHTDNSITTLTPIYSLNNENITKISAGWEFTLAINDKGQLLSWGSNNFGQLGRLTKQNYDSSPGEVCITDQEVKVKDIETGLRHSLALTEAGDVYAWGQGKKGQLGFKLSDITVIQQPTKVVLPEKVCKIFCGSFHSGVVTVSGCVYVWGSNKYGQNSQDNSDSRTNIVTIPANIGSFKQIKSGWTHILLVTDDGKVYSWGRGDYGQLGRQCYNQYDNKPGLVDYLPSIKQISCGSEHNLALDKDGNIYSWGWNEHGICGTGDEENVLMPRMLQTLCSVEISHIGCGAGHSLAVVK